MLSYMKDGKRIECPSLYAEAKPGQMVVLTAVSWGENPNTKMWPLAAYPQPSLFVVVGVAPNDERHIGVAMFLLRDMNGKEFATPLGIGIHDASDWLTWNAGKHREDLRQKNARIQHLEAQVALLRGILVDQGVKLITPEQAKTLGLDTRR